MDDFKVLKFPTCNIHDAKDDGLTDQDIINLIMGVVKLLEKHVDSERVNALSRMSLLEIMEAFI